MRNDKTTLARPAEAPASLSTPVVTPLSPSVVFASRTPDELDAQYEGRASGFTYAREGHPNAAVLAQRLDALEGASGGIVTSSGMSAVTAAIMGLLGAGDHIIGGDQLYGRSLRLMHEDLPRFGIETSVADPTDADALARAVRPNTKAVLVEVVSNPTLRVADMEGIARLCGDKGLLLMVDNTFTTPQAYLPFAHGADAIIPITPARRICWAGRAAIWSALSSGAGGRSPMRWPRPQRASPLPRPWAMWAQRSAIPPRPRTGR